MKSIFRTLFVIIAVAVVAAAHPLGNFSINQYSRLEVGASEIRIRQVLDIAEIPTIQLGPEIDADNDGVFSPVELENYAAVLTPRMISGLDLEIDSRRTGILVESSDVKLQPGAGNLSALRFEWIFKAAVPDLKGNSLIAFHNRNFEDRRGWSEMVVNSVGNVSIFDSNAFGNGITDELRDYPRESLDSPLNERSANFTASLTEKPSAARALRNRDGQFSKTVARDRLAELISVPEMTPLVIAVGLLIAFGLGAFHAMSPGHGKAVVGAYLVGSRGTVKHALFLGMTVTVTHTLGVFALGLITLFASNFILAEKLMPMLSFVSGLMVFYIGISIFKTRLFSALGWETKSGHHHHHHDHPDGADDHHHDQFTHTHDGHTHSHLPPEAITWRSLLALGISGGLLPCPSALVLMLSAISLGRAGYGIILTLAFSFGLASTLTAVGLMFLYLGKAIGGSRVAGNRLFKLMPAVSAFVIACVGALICWDSFRG